jgi:hypothetical protein
MPPNPGAGWIQNSYGYYRVGYTMNTSDVYIFTMAPNCTFLNCMIACQGAFGCYNFVYVQADNTCHFKMDVLPGATANLAAISGLTAGFIAVNPLISNKYY